MDVHLLVYDLSRGLARQMSMGLLGFQLDAVYHTSIEINGLEYVYDGNVVAIKPGSSHLGQPMERIHLGRTECTSRPRLCDPKPRRADLRLSSSAHGRH